MLPVFRRFLWTTLFVRAHAEENSDRQAYPDLHSCLPRLCTIFSEITPLLSLATLWEVRVNVEDSSITHPVHFSLIIGKNSVTLVKWSDVETTRIKQYELEVFAADLAARRSLIACSNCRGCNNDHAVSACECGIQPPNGSLCSHRECGERRDAGIACSARVRAGGSNFG